MYYENKEQFIEDFNIYFRFCGINDINNMSTDNDIEKAFKKAKKMLHPDTQIYLNPNMQPDEIKKYEEYFKNLNEIHNKYREFKSGKKGINRNYYEDPQKDTQQNNSSREFKDNSGDLSKTKQQKSERESQARDKKAEEREQEEIKWANQFIRNDILNSKNVSYIIFQLKRAKDSQLDMAIIFKEIYIILNSLQLEKKYFDRIWDLYMENANEGNNIFNLAESIAMGMTDEGHVFNFILTIDEFISRSNQREKMNDDLVDLWVTLIDQGKIKDKKSIYDFCDIFKKDEQILRLIDVLKKQGFEEDTIYFTLQDIGIANGYGSEVLERCLIEFKPDLKELVRFVQYARLTDIKILEYLDSSRPEFATADVKLELINKIDNQEEKIRRYEIMKNSGEIDWKKAFKWDNKIYKSDSEPKKPIWTKLFGKREKERSNRANRPIRSLKKSSRQ